MSGAVDDPIHLDNPPAVSTTQAAIQNDVIDDVINDVAILEPQPAPQKRAPAPRKFPWKCASCEEGFDVPGGLVNHHRVAHGRNKSILDLAPAGLAICPFCEKVYEALRGWRAHVNACQRKHQPFYSFNTTLLPKPCLVWIPKQANWYEGQVFRASESPVPSWEVMFLNAETRTERFDRVFVLPDLDLSFEQIAFGSSPPQLGGSVLEECGLDDNDCDEMGATQVDEDSQDFKTELTSVSTIAHAPIHTTAHLSVATAPSVATHTSLGSTITATITTTTLIATATPAIPQSIDSKHDTVTTSSTIGLTPSSVSITNSERTTTSLMPATHTSGAMSSMTSTSGTTSSTTTTLSAPSRGPIFTSRVIRKLAVHDTLKRKVFQKKGGTPTILADARSLPIVVVRKQKFFDSQLAPCMEGDDHDHLLPDWFGSSILNDDFVPSKQYLTGLISKMHLKANPLRALPALELWTPFMKKTWETSVADFIPYFQAALTSDSKSTTFLKLLLRLQELPTLALLKLIPDPKAPSDGRASLPEKLKKVESLTLQNRLSAATKVLFSHGIAKPTQEVFIRLQKLHPSLKEEIPILSTQIDQFTLSPSEAKEVIFKKCIQTWFSMDPFGWNTSLLHLIRGAPGEDSFFTL